jgi:hypothetical protein
MMSGAALVVMVAGAAAPAPASAQLGKLLKKALKEKVVQTVMDKAASAAGVQPDTAPAREVAPAGETGVLQAKTPMPGAHPGPNFSEYLLEMTPELLDRFEKGLAAESAVQQELNLKLGKVLSPAAYHECMQRVMSGPEAQKIYLVAGDLVQGEVSQEQMMKVSQELGRRFERLIEPKCGLDSQKGQQVRDQHAQRLEAAAPQASSLTRLQLSLMKERILPVCAAIETLAEVAGEARIPTASAAIYWVYTRGEVAALQPRCVKLAAALKTAL